MATPVLHLLAGPNGAGKSTFVAEVSQPKTHLAFVNADLIAAELWPGTELEHAYDASEAAAEMRRTMMGERASFITETVFSHPSKVDLVADASALGYLVHLHVILVPPTLPVARVAFRVQQGGHDVPTDKIRARYERLWPLVAAARELADRTTLYDNTNAEHPFREIAVYDRGRLIGEATWPTWTPSALLD
ncbi:MAG TPA: zeta toxin family protein [Nocardioides sp.]